MAILTKFLGTKAKLIIGAILVVAAIGITWHYVHLVNKVGNLAATVEQEQENHKETKASFQEFIQETERSFQYQQQVISRRAKAFRQYEENLNELQTLYSKHDFDKLLEAKPGLMERRINDASDKLLKRLRSVSAFEGIITSGESNTSPPSTNNPP